ncbi:glycosyl transferase group 1 [Nitrosococcus halophilus Nc 4]|uniref:Glycosyl transferase group 1 n=2 Tax=Nitrosococcus halophilus TaxID=133539 RepID=D5BWH1_NITHN|nr:glycosyl transferase group 1 [Nitrosococcus halophilus Nc 4]
MKICMLTNTFTPHVGGVARSISNFTAEYRRLGHQVLVVAPLFEGTPLQEQDVIRIPAIEHFRGSDFSIPLPVPGRLAAALKKFAPDVLHSHHPFLLGDTALRIGAAQNLPVVFTYHTMYEQYTHYVPADSPRLKRFAIDLASGYCNLCDGVIAPSDSIARILRQRGLKVPMEVIPTGVEVEYFVRGDGQAFRRDQGIPADAFLVGHIGRLAPEKNLNFLSNAVAQFLLQNEKARFLVAGDGPSAPEIKRLFESLGLGSRLDFIGILKGSDLANAYQAMDVFVFASQSETQGLVLAEAMAASTPVVALDAPGVREVVIDHRNGRLLFQEDAKEFAAALSWMCSLTPAERRNFEEAARETANHFSMTRCAHRALKFYNAMQAKVPSLKSIERSHWAIARHRIEIEWEIMRNIAAAVSDSVRTPSGNNSP